MMEDDFKDIAPFEGKDFDDAVSRLIQYPQLLNNFTDIISRHSRIVNKWKSFHDFARNSFPQGLHRI